MRITDSTVAMAAQRQYRQSTQETLSIRIERAAPPPAPRQEVELSGAGRQRALDPVDEKAAEENLDPRIRLIRSLLEAMLGIEIELAPAVNLDGGSNSAPASTTPSSPQNGARIDYHREFSEAETTHYAAAGVVRTADGREISFQSELTLARSYHEEVNINITTGSAARPQKDPLVLNYDAPAATLSERTFSFDIDSDGRKDNISLLTRGSAFLALDRNGDGKVNDGNELFGTLSGDGFADLATLDLDANGWIDAGDDVFAKLKLWLKDDSGQDKLVTLASLGIGALYLGNSKADFSLNTAQNTSLGTMRASGIYLKESGTAGTLQQIDMAV
ncbi:hypothetical protein [Chitinilyticum aquatile]|uniref:hypothetical protein n=1 Tax=Chitinilyticum aquatile TaxID=362520 RepID=UPI00041B2ECE|nr:hypothetical protein [Chitinilyticum aquatile]